MVICLELGADLHMAQLMPLPLTVFCFSKIQIGFAFLVPAHLGSPGKRAIKRVCVYICTHYNHLQRQKLLPKIHRQRSRCRIYLSFFPLLTLTSNLFPVLPFPVHLPFSITSLSFPLLSSPFLFSS